MAELKICPRCNTELEEMVEKCPRCNFHFQKGIKYDRSELVGYSDVIHHKELKAKSKRGKNAFVYIGYSAALLFLSIFTLAGYYSPNVPTIAGVLLGFVTAFFFSFYARTQQKNMANDRTWDAYIRDKDVEVRTGKKKREERIYKIQVLRESGKSHWIDILSGQAAAAYYNIDDQVRHHKGYHYPEKFDKSRDDKCICIHCGTLNEMKLERCDKCSLPLLKYGKGIKK